MISAMPVYDVTSELRGYAAKWLRCYAATLLRGNVATWLRGYYIHVLARLFRVMVDTNVLKTSAIFFTR